jgi:hypothetical protein
VLAAGELSEPAQVVAITKQLVHLIVPHLPVIISLGLSFVTLVGVKTVLGFTFGGMFFALASRLLPHFRGRSSATIEAGPLKVSWDGAATMALLVVGVFMMMIGFYAFVFRNQII